LREYDAQWSKWDGYDGRNPYFNANVNVSQGPVYYPNTIMTPNSFHGSIAGLNNKGFPSNFEGQKQGQIQNLKFNPTNGPFNSMMNMKPANFDDNLGRTTMNIPNKVVPNTLNSTGNNNTIGAGFNNSNDTNKNFYSQNTSLNNSKKVFYSSFGMNRILPPPPPLPSAPLSSQTSANINLMNPKPSVSINNYNGSKKTNVNTNINIFKYGSEDHFVNVNSKNYNNNSNTSNNNSNINDGNTKLLNFSSNENLNACSVMSSLNSFTTDNKNSTFNSKASISLRPTKSYDTFHLPKTVLDSDSLDEDILSKTCDLCLKKSGNIELLHCHHV